VFFARTTRGCRQRRGRQQSEIAASNLDVAFIGIVIQPNAIEGLKVAADFSSISLQGLAAVSFNTILGDINALGSASLFQQSSNRQFRRRRRRMNPSSIRVH